MILANVANLAAQVAHIMANNPWDQFERLHCFPKNCNCEPMRFGELILQPMAVITSIPYSLVGFLALFKLRGTQFKRLQFLAWIYIFQGIASAFLHSSFISFSRYMDFGAIFSILAWIICNIKFPKEPMNKFLFKWFILAIVPTYLISVFKERFALIFAVYFLITVLISWNHYKEHPQNKQTIDYLLTGIIFVIVGGLCFILDRSRLMCFEQWHFYGHSLWHILTSLAMYQVFQYFLFHEKRAEIS
ncbi:ceramidase domain-containing protein [Bacteriovorax sp. DB6_IX]|uniref:ceramidase domain-containing protein n=1 Tax=Bacteriovorax sp. DB6_IX TaxID=1353530 RepID=UPI0018E04F17|nr:ceramidase domain-containing protein [Bacteriovorax sp. DB6_IX]